MSGPPPAENFTDRRRYRVPEIALSSRQVPVGVNRRHSRGASGGPDEPSPEGEIPANLICETM